jgi:hypothetical protein
VELAGDLPQPLQNFCLAGFVFPQERQLSVLAKGAAHSPQKLASAGFSKPQATHRIDGHSGGQSEGTVDPGASYAQGTTTGEPGESSRRRKCTATIELGVHG